MSVYSLPSKVFEPNLPKLLSGLARLDAHDDEVTLDFGRVEYWIPAAIVSTCAIVNRWKERGREVYFQGHCECPAFGYFQRVDFFDRVGLKLPEGFRRHDPGTSFVEVRRVDPGPARLQDPLARQLASCLAGTEDENDDVLRLSEFSLGEVMANVQQHAEKPGFVSAQYVKARDCARIGIADYGIGIRESFRKAGSPHFREGMTHAGALELAMQPWVSSKRHIRTGPYGESPNRGVGLKMVKHLVTESCGELFVASGDAWVQYHGRNLQENGNLPNGLNVPGTVVSVQFRRGQIDDYREILAAAQSAMNLITDPEDDRFFS